MAAILELVKILYPLGRKKKIDKVYYYFMPVFINIIIIAPCPWFMKTDREIPSFWLIYIGTNKKYLDYDLLDIIQINFNY